MFVLRYMQEYTHREATSGGCLLIQTLVIYADRSYSEMFVLRYSQEILGLRKHRKNIWVDMIYTDGNYSGMFVSRFLQKYIGLKKLINNIRIYIGTYTSDYFLDASCERIIR